MALTEQRVIEIVTELNNSLERRIFKEINKSNQYNVGIVNSFNASLELRMDKIESKVQSRFTEKFVKEKIDEQFVGLEEKILGLVKGLYNAPERPKSD